MDISRAGVKFNRRKFKNSFKVPLIYIFFFPKRRVVCTVFATAIYFLSSNKCCVVS